MSGKISTGLYLQRQDDPMLWEEVDQYIWDNWTKALLNGSPRYSGNRVSKRNGSIHITASSLTNRDLAIITRFCGVRDNEAPSSLPGGFVRTPEFVPFVIRGKTTLHENGGGDFVYKPTTKKPTEGVA